MYCSVSCLLRTVNWCHWHHWSGEKELVSEDECARKVGCAWECGVVFKHECEGVCEGAGADVKRGAGACAGAGVWRGVGVCERMGWGKCHSAGVSRCNRKGKKDVVSVSLRPKGCCYRSSLAGIRFEVVCTDAHTLVTAPVHRSVRVRVRTCEWECGGTQMGAGAHARVWVGVIEWVRVYACDLVGVSVVLSVKERVRASKEGCKCVRMGARAYVDLRSGACRCEGAESKSLYTHAFAGASVVRGAKARARWFASTRAGQFACASRNC